MKVGHDAEPEFVGAEVLQIASVFNTVVKRIRVHELPRILKLLEVCEVRLLAKTIRGAFDLRGLNGGRLLLLCCKCTHYEREIEKVSKRERERESM